MASFEALYGRKCRTPLSCSDLDEALTLGPYLIQETTETIRKIREYIRTAQSQQKSHADKRRWALEFDIGEKVILKGITNQGYTKVWSSSKLSPTYIGPYEIIEKLSTVAYRVDLPIDLKHVHNIFPTS